nr:hypothetical protein [Tanacetum cinerariifolium]
LKGKEILTEAVSLNPIDPKLLKIDVAPLVPKLRKNRTAHTDYIRHTLDEAATLREIVKSERLLSPLNTSLDYACKYTRRIQYASGSMSQDNTKKNRIQRTQRKAKKNKVEDHLRTVKSSLIKKSVVDSKATSSKFLGMVKFRNDHVAKIMGYGDYQIGNMTISRVYYVEGLGHNLFSVGQFCGSNLASKTKSWLWHRRLSHLNFGAINHLVRQGLVQGLSKLKFEKDHLCSACAMGKSTKKTHKPKSEDTNQEKLYLLHMDLCRPMRVESVNGKKYILVIVDDYS